MEWLEDMDNSIVITVIMSVYNTEPLYLEESIKSILNQTCELFEFLIFDDASDEKTKKVLRKYSCQDKRIKVIENNLNKGLTYNLFQGVAVAQGEYICRQDADDISYPERFEEQLKYMRKYKDTAMLATGYYILCDGKRKKRSFGSSNPDYIKARLFLENSHILHSSVMFRKEFLRNYNLNYNVDIKKSQDYDFWVRISRVGKIKLLRKYLCVYRQHKNQISTERQSKKEQRKYFYEILLKQLEEIGINPTKREKIAHCALAAPELRCNFITVTNWVIKLIKYVPAFEYFDKRFYRIVVLKRYMKYIYKNYIINKKYI